MNIFHLITDTYFGIRAEEFTGDDAFEKLHRAVTRALGRTPEDLTMDMDHMPTSWTLREHLSTHESWTTTHTLCLGIRSIGKMTISAVKGPAPVTKLDPAGNPVLKATALETFAAGTMNLIQAWLDGEPVPFPEDAKDSVRAYLMAYETRRTA